jgi:hypothetical protein
VNWLGWGSGLAAGMLLRGLRAAGGLAGDGQEGFFQGGPAQGQCADVQPGGGQPGGHGGKDPGAVGDGQDDPARCLIDGRLGRAERGQRTASRRGSWPGGDCRSRRSPPARDLS